MKTTRTPLKNTLRQIAPNVAIHTCWSLDPDSSGEWNEMTQPGNCFEGESREDWTPWQAEIKVIAVVDSEQVTCSVYMGGIWEKEGDEPRFSNPEISGYKNQMTREALQDLTKLVGPEQADRLNLSAAISECESQA